MLQPHRTLLPLQNMSFFLHLFFLCLEYPPCYLPVKKPLNCPDPAQVSAPLFILRQLTSVGMVLYRGCHILSPKHQMVNILGFEGYTVSAATPHLCPYSTKVATDNMKMNGHSWVPMQLSLWTWELDFHKTCTSPYIFLLIFLQSFKNVEWHSYLKGHTQTGMGWIWPVGHRLHTPPVVRKTAWFQISASSFTTTVFPQK